MAMGSLSFIIFAVIYLVLVVVNRLPDTVPKGDKYSVDLAGLIVCTLGMSCTIACFGIFLVPAPTAPRGEGGRGDYERHSTSPGAPFGRE